MPTPFVSFRAGEVAPAITSRAGDSALGAVADRDLGRYYHALAEELRAIRLSEAEALVIVDALDGVPEEPHSIGLLWATVSDSLDHGLAKWEGDGAALVARLRSLTYAQCLAIVDAVERARLSGEDLTEAVRRVGLVRR